MDLEVVYSDKNMFVALVYSNSPESPWILSAIYGPYRRAKGKFFGKCLKIW